MKSWPSRSATSGTNSWPGRSVRESNEAPSSDHVGADERAAGRRGDVGCPESHGAERYRVAIGGGRPMASRAHQPRRALRRPVGRARRQLRDGGPRARAPPTRRATRSPPVGIRREGEWELAEGAVERWTAGPAGAARPARPVGRRSHPRRCSPTPPPAGAHRGAAAAARSAGRGRHGAGDARAGRRAVRRLRRARLGAGDGQGDGQAGAGRARHPPGPLPGVRRARAHAGPARRAGRGARAAVLRQAGEHGLVGRRDQGARRRGSCATRSSSR